MGKRESGAGGKAHIVPTAVIGGGASGCMAAVSAALSGDQVLLFEAGDRIGKKIYATGNGRCNLTNLYMDQNCYHVGGGIDLSAFFSRFSVSDHMHFWESRGIFLHDRQGYVYPRTDQAATIAEGYEKILRGLTVQIVTGARVRGIRPEKRGGRTVFRIETEKGDRYMASHVVLAGGGAAGPQYGCAADMYGIAAGLGHLVRKPLPALVPLLSDDRVLKTAAGVRCGAKIRLVIGGVRAAAERGELQITERGISGIPVFQISAAAVRALHEGKSVTAVIDFLPDPGPEKWQKEKERRLGEDRDCMLGVFLLGLVNKKVLNMVLERRGLQAEKKASRLTDRELDGILEDLRAFPIRINGSGDFRQAQVTSGGVPLSELDQSLQSKRVPGLYMAGELIDVDGICGGYNLQWAATSGWIAGRASADHTHQEHDK